jgi:glycosyltransferase involved in cell wall biosynthesis
MKSALAPNPPTVSVILPTFNWPSVLSYAIQTVLRQTFTDFELLVIGDCCTDNTAEVVSTFNDPRVRWHNLPQNCGNQAGPNNVGLELARADFVAYMHQDDLWLPNHLAVLVQAMQTHDVPLAQTLLLEVGPQPECLRRVIGLANTGGYGPDKVPISTPAVMHRTDIGRRAGGWRDWKLLYQTPPSDFWERILSLDARLLTLSEITVVKFHSAARKNSYIEQLSGEQANYFQRIQAEPDFLYRELLQVLHGQARGLKVVRFLPPRPLDAKPGWLIDQYRQIRGLEAATLGRHRSVQPFLRLIRHHIGMLYRRIRGGRERV